MEAQKERRNKKIVIIKFIKVVVAGANRVKLLSLKLSIVLLG